MKVWHSKDNRKALKKLTYAKAQLELAEAYLNDLDEADKIVQGRLDKAFALNIDPKNLPKTENMRRSSIPPGWSSC